MKTIALNTLITQALEESKGLEIVTLDVKTRTDIADFMIVCTGTSNRHVNALANNLIQAVKAAKVTVNHAEGEDTGEWIVVDLGDVLVHIMQAHTRALYKLETLWTRGE